MRVAAYHVGRVQYRLGYRIVDAAAFLGGFRRRRVHQFFLRVVHQNHGFGNALAHNHAAGNRTVGVEHFHPVVIHQPCFLGIDFRNPHVRAATREREHAQVFRIGAVDTPFLVRREEVERDFRIAVGHFAQEFLGGFGVHGGAVHAEGRTEIAHPFVVLVKLLAAGERAPRNQLVHVGIAGGVAHFFALHARPNRRGNNLARLGDDVAEADLRVLAGVNQVRMIAAGDFAQRLPCFFRNMAVGFRRQRQNHLGRIDGGFDFRLAFARAFGLHAVELAQVFHFVLGIPRHAFAVVVHFFQQGADRGEFLVNRAVVAFHHGHGRHGFARNRLALAQLPVFRVERLAEFLRAVVHQRREHDVFAHAQIVFGQLAEFFG